MISKSARAEDFGGFINAVTAADSVLSRKAKFRYFIACRSPIHEPSLYERVYQTLLKEYTNHFWESIPINSERVYQTLLREYTKHLWEGIPITSERVHETLLREYTNHFWENIPVTSEWVNQPLELRKSPPIELEVSLFKNDTKMNHVKWFSETATPTNDMVVCIMVEWFPWLKTLVRSLMRIIGNCLKNSPNLIRCEFWNKNQFFIFFSIADLTNEPQVESNLCPQAGE